MHREAYRMLVPLGSEPVTEIEDRFYDAIHEKPEYASLILKASVAASPRVPATTRTLNPIGRGDGIRSLELRLRRGLAHALTERHLHNHHKMLRVRMRDRVLVGLQRHILARRFDGDGLRNLNSLSPSDLLSTLLDYDENWQSWFVFITPSWRLRDAHDFERLSEDRESFEDVIELARKDLHDKANSELFMVAGDHLYEAIEYCRASKGAVTRQALESKFPVTGVSTAVLVARLKEAGISNLAKRGNQGKQK